MLVWHPYLLIKVISVIIFITQELYGFPDELLTFLGFSLEMFELLVVEARKPVLKRKEMKKYSILQTAVYTSSMQTPIKPITIFWALKIKSFKRFRGTLTQHSGTNSNVLASKTRTRTLTETLGDSYGLFKDLE